MVDACSLIWYGGDVEDDAFPSGLVDTIGTHCVDTESRSRPVGFSSAVRRVSICSWSTLRLCRAVAEGNHLRAAGPAGTAENPCPGNDRRLHPDPGPQSVLGNSPFADAIREVQRDPYAASADIYEEEEYRQMRLLVTDDGRAGVAIKGDEIVSAFGAHKDCAHPKAVQSMLS